jgi:hypothetical protein
MMGEEADNAEACGRGWAFRMGSHAWDGPGGGDPTDLFEEIGCIVRYLGFECTVAEVLGGWRRPREHAYVVLLPEIIAPGP